MNILVTGAAGFVGRNLVENLKNIRDGKNRARPEIQIDEIYERAINAGATGGKLLGAGGAGFMIFYVPENRQDIVRMALADLREMNFEMDNSGASIIFVDKDFG